MVDHTPAVLLVLHDVAPETWCDYQPFVADVDALGDIPMTHLVVPDFHKRNPIGESPDFLRQMNSRLARGDELALHGLYHCDDAPSPRTPYDYFMRRVYTWEGEFFGLKEDQAMHRLETGLETFRCLDWPVHGFVAPAWLMSEGTRRALRKLPLRYTSDPSHIYSLPEFTAIDAPGLVWSARSAWRRGVSKVVCDHRKARFSEAPVIRLGLHPVDMRHEFSRRYWLNTLRQLLAEGRQPMTKHAWLASQARLAVSPAKCA